MNIENMFVTALARTLPSADARSQSTNPRRRLALCGALLLGLSALRAGGADQSSDFDAGADEWRASDPSAALAWESSGGTPGGYLRGSRSGSTNVWHLLSPLAWAGDWRVFKALRFLVRPEAASRNTYGLNLWVSTRNGTNLTVVLPLPYGSWTPRTVRTHIVAVRCHHQRV